MAERTCSVEGCERAAKARGWCFMHYQRAMKWGAPGGPAPEGPRTNTPESFWDRVELVDGCLVWTGCTIRNGYGLLGWQGKNVLAHRLSFFLRTGRWPDMDLRHLCNNPPCVLHVVEGTRSENVQDSILAGTHKQSSQTHCKNGHPFDAVNGKGRRECITCRKAYMREYMRDRRARLGGA